MALIQPQSWHRRPLEQLPRHCDNSQPHTQASDKIRQLAAGKIGMPATYPRFSQDLGQTLPRYSAHIRRPDTSQCCAQAPCARQYCIG